MQEKTLHYDWIDAAKGLGIIFVVLGHAIGRYNAKCTAFWETLSDYIQLSYAIVLFSFRILWDKSSSETEIT